MTAKMGERDTKADVSKARGFDLGGADSDLSCDNRDFGCPTLPATPTWNVRRYGPL